MKSSAEIAKSVFEAFASQDRAAIERLLAEDFRFTSPLDNALDRQQYLEICWPNSAAITGFDFQYVIADGDRVFVTYEGQANNGKRFRNTEIITVRNESVVAVEVYFGPV